MKISTKKTIAIILSALFVVSFCGCTSQDDEVLTVGITQIADHPSLDNCRNGFIEGLKQEGFTEDKNIKFDYQGANNDGSVQNTIAQSFVTNQVDLICAISTPSALACYNAAAPKDIPVIFTAISDPVLSKLATDKTTPVKGISGTCDQLPAENQLKMIRALMPNAKNIGILYNTSEINSQSQISLYESLAPTYGFKIITKGVSAAEELPLAIDDLLTKVDCVTNLTDNLVVNNLPILIEKATENKIPVFGSEEEQVLNGCLASEGLDYFALGIETGKMAAKVLQGESVESLPIMTIEDSNFFVNKNLLSTFNITLPSEYEERANYL